MFIEDLISVSQISAECNLNSGRKIACSGGRVSHIILSFINSISLSKVNLIRPETSLVTYENEFTRNTVSFMIIFNAAKFKQ